MFRRIELISTFEHRGGGRDAYESGLMGPSLDPVADAWVEKLRGPGGRTLPANTRFYFTEKGWREIGRRVVAACGQSGQEYRIIRVKENEVNVVWRDNHTDYEVAAQPKKRRDPGARP